MSLLQKFQSFFKQKEEVAPCLAELLKPQNQKNFDKALGSFSLLLLKNTDAVFALLRSKEQMQNYKPKPEHILNLLLALHKNVTDDEISVQLRGQPLFWLQKLMEENKESFRLVERMMTEPSTSSFFPQCQPQTTHQKPPEKKVDQLQDKRKARIELNKQLDNPVIKTEFQINPQSIKPKIFCLIYYSYLQKLSVNIPVYEGVQQMRYPYEHPDDLKLKYIWIYKIQNIMCLGLKLMECSNPKFQLYKSIIYQDMVAFQLFIKREIDELIQSYVTMGNLDCLSLYEVYQEFNRAKAVLMAFEPAQDFRLDSNQKDVDEFLTFAVRLKVMNQFAFKKSIKVPNRHQPDLGVKYKGQCSDKKNLRSNSDCNKENLEQLNLRDFEYDRQYEREVAEKRFYNKSTEQSMEDVPEIENVPPQRLMHVKGLSTFHQ